MEVTSRFRGRKQIDQSKNPSSAVKSSFFYYKRRIGSFSCQNQHQAAEIGIPKLDATRVVQKAMKRMYLRARRRSQQQPSARSGTGTTKGLEIEEVSKGHQQPAEEPGSSVPNPPNSKGKEVATELPQQPANKDGSVPDPANSSSTETDEATKRYLQPAYDPEGTEVVSKPRQQPTKEGGSVPNIPRRNLTAETKAVLKRGKQPAYELGLVANPNTTGAQVVPKRYKKPAYKRGSNPSAPPPNATGTEVLLKRRKQTTYERGSVASPAHPNSVGAEVVSKRRKQTTSQRRSVPHPGHPNNSAGTGMVYQQPAYGQGNLVPNLFHPKGTGLFSICYQQPASGHGHLVPNLVTQPNSALAYGSGGDTSGQYYMFPILRPVGTSEAARYPQPSNMPPMMLPFLNGTLHHQNQNGGNSASLKIAGKQKQSDGGSSNPHGLDLELKLSAPDGLDLDLKL